MRVTTYQLVYTQDIDIGQESYTGSSEIDTGSVLELADGFFYKIHWKEQTSKGGYRLHLLQSAQSEAEAQTRKPSK